MASLRAQPRVIALFVGGCLALLLPRPAGAQGEPPAATPEPDHVEPDHVEEHGRSGLEHGPRVDLAMGAISPDDPALDTEFMAALSADAVGVAFAPVGLALAYGLTFGFNGDANAYFDGRASVGPGLDIGPLMFAPMLGVGFDVLGGDDPATYRFDIAPYWYAEGRLRLESSLGGVEQAVSWAARGTFSNAATDAPNEIRLVSRAFLLMDGYYELSAGFSYTDYDTADAALGLVGFGF